MKKSKKIILSVSLSTLLVTTLSLADEKLNNSDNKLGDITIVDSVGSDYTSIPKTTTNRNNLELMETTKSIQVYNEDFLNDYKPQSIVDIIQMSSSTTYLGDNHGRGNQFSIRGFNNVPILKDNMKFSNSIANTELYNLESIEVLKGPDSLQYGQSSPGGLINLIKKKPIKDNFTELEFEVTSNNSYSPKIDIGGTNDDGSLRYRVVSVYKNDEGFYNTDVKTKRIFIAPSIAYDLNNNHTLTLVSEYLNETSPSSFGTYVDSNGKLVSDRKDLASNPEEEFEKTQKIIGFDFDSSFDTWNSNFKYRYIDYKGDNGDVHLPSGYDQTTNTIRRLYAFQIQELKEHALQYTVNKDLEIFNTKNKLSLGADFNKADSKLDMYYDPLTPYIIDASNPVYEPLTSLSDHPSAMNLSRDMSTTKTYGVFLQDNIFITDDLIFNVGARYSKTNPDNGQKSDATTPSFGIVYKYSPQTSIYANYSVSFNPQTSTDRNGDILDPEEGKGYEVGLKQKLFDDKFNLTTALYKVEKENIALSDPTLPNTFIASGKQQSQGLELDLMGKITKDLSIVASYGYTDTKDKDNDNKELSGVAKHTANFFTKYSLSEFNIPNAYIAGGVQYIGKRNMNSNITIDSDIIYNASLGYQKDKLRFSLNVKNLTDKEYFYTYPNQSKVQVGTPRTFIASVTYTF